MADSFDMQSQAVALTVSAINAAATQLVVPHGTFDMLGVGGSTDKMVLLGSEVVLVTGYTHTPRYTTTPALLSPVGPGDEVINVDQADVFFAELDRTLTEVARLEEPGNGDAVTTYEYVLVRDVLSPTQLLVARGQPQPELDPTRFVPATTFATGANLTPTQGLRETWTIARAQEQTAAEPHSAWTPISRYWRTSDFVTPGVLVGMRTAEIIMRTSSATAWQPRSITSHLLVGGYVATSSVFPLPAGAEVTFGNSRYAPYNESGYLELGFTKVAGTDGIPAGPADQNASWFAYGYWLYAGARLPYFNSDDGASVRYSLNADQTAVVVAEAGWYSVTAFASEVKTARG